MCTGNTVKTSVGNGTSCDGTCDGVKAVPNEGHTDCGKYFIIFLKYIML